MRRETKKNVRSSRRGAVIKDRPLFSAEEKLIYRFKECGRTRAVDPIRVASELAASDPSLDFLIKTMTLPTPDAGKNTVLAAAIIRKAFGCAEEKEENGQIIGMMDGDCIALFNDFVLWVEEIKKKFNISSSFAMPSAPAGSPENSPMPTTPESTSARTGFFLGEPSQPQSPLPSVSEKLQPGFTTP